MKIYTKTGDRGQTGLLGGVRVSKDDIRVDTYGTFDEVNSFIGLLRTRLDSNHSWQDKLHQIQVELMNTMSHLATPEELKGKNKMPLPDGMDVFCEKWIDEIENSLSSKSDYFILPGGNEISALCHVVRTQLRRGERKLIGLHNQHKVERSILLFINRLSDLFFSLSRAALEEANLPEERWRAFMYNREEK
ncbi:cob(I)yrinic acid a,c-diamide adenosyltransferase [Carboxylicivirga caseinilyticus]|uniref:cob(I)yrinic acid a,c-diamide adenosyltransferase n=1 Tax=Carboxylicivirga caseinilyticus TaxID=3417572 RepID=UPI003D351FBA|nr:cob(I)yrinic acid a,c-diamide adenosyltransferase [Marinilabiliaceae bacterium A049]